MSFMEWYENTEVWESLDDLMLNIWPAIDRLFTELSKHEREFPLQTKAWMFGGIGQFSASYVEARNNGMDEIRSYELAVNDVANNPLMQKMLKQVMNDAVDGVVSKMEERT